MTSALPALEVKDLHKRFGGVRALAGVGFRVEQGCSFGLIGPNGAGKTTLLNVITGLAKNEQGSVFVLGTNCTGEPPENIAAAGVARTFQNVRIFARLTVLDNLLVSGESREKGSLFGALLPGAKRADEALVRRAKTLLERTGLLAFAESPAETLAYGHQRRLELARALMRGPRLLLLDEPAAGMNPTEAQSLGTLVGELRREHDLTVVLVEHNVPLVMSVCDRVHVLDHGESLAEGPPKEVVLDRRVLAAYLGDAPEAPREVRPTPARSASEAELANAEKRALLRTKHPFREAASLERHAPLLEVDNLAVSYGGIRAVRGVSLAVGRGEVVTLLGANGAGKTSTLCALAGLRPSAGGRVKLAGEEITNLAADAIVRRGLSLVPEGRAVLKGLTVAENLRLGAYSHRHALTTSETLYDVFSLFPRLRERVDQKAGTLSGGEQQMLAIGRALMARPAIVLLDEPSLGLAPLVTRQIFDAISSVASSGVSVLLVEQNTRLALEASRRAYVMKSGEIVLSGDAVRLAQDPEVRAAYLGA